MRSDRILLLAFDHIFLGLLPGIESLDQKIIEALKGHPDGILINYGILRRLGPVIRQAGAAPVLRLDGNRTYLAGDWTKSPEWEMFYTAHCAATAGAEAAIVNLLIGGPAELSSIKVVASAAAACQDVGIPLIVSAIALDSAMQSSNDPQNTPEARLRFVTRLAYELGADIVNAYDVANPQIIRKILPVCHVPTIASGASTSGGPAQLIDWVTQVVREGAAGVCVGRAVWQNTEPGEITRDLRTAIDDTVPVLLDRNLDSTI